MNSTSQRQPAQSLFWLRFLMFPCLALAGQGLLLVWGSQLPWSAQMVAICGVGYAWFHLAGSFHEAAHQTLFTTRRANEWYGQIVGLLIGIPFTSYAETHRRHHAYLNTPDDYELWPYCDPAWSKTSRRLFAWFDLILGVITSPIIYGRIGLVAGHELPIATRRKIRREYAALMLYWTGLTAGFFALRQSSLLPDGALQPQFLLPWLFSSSFNTFRKFAEHLGMASLDPIYGTRTVCGPGLWTRLSSYFNFDLYIHGPHHRYPRLTGSELQAKLAELQSKQAPSLPVFTSYWGALWDMLPHLVFNPGVGVNAQPAAAATSQTPITERRAA